MESTKIPFWEESYKRKGKLDTFGGGKDQIAGESLGFGLRRR